MDVQKDAKILFQGKVDDFEKEIMETGAKVGFSESLIKQLLTRSTDRADFQGGYEDYDTERGLLRPAISAKGFDITINPVLILPARAS